MSEYHTQQARLSEYENLYSDALERNYEQEAQINRLERLREATDEQIEYLQEQNERQNIEFKSVTDGLKSSIKVQEEKYRQQIAAERKNQLNNLKKVAGKFNTQLNQLKQSVSNQLITERRNTKELIQEVRNEARSLVSNVRMEIGQQLNVHTQQISALDNSVKQLKNDVQQIISDKNQAASAAIAYYEDLNRVITNEEREISLFHKQSYWPLNVHPIKSFKARLDLVKESISKNQYSTALSQSIELYSDFIREREHIENSHNELSNNFRMLLSEYKSLLTRAEDSREVTIGLTDITKLKYDVDNKKWIEEKKEESISVDFFTDGKLTKFLEKYLPNYENLSKKERERNHSVDKDFVEKLRKRLIDAPNSITGELDYIVREARDTCLNSNIREAMGKKVIDRLTEKYGTMFSVIKCGFEGDDRRKNYHLHMKVNGIERHLILGVNKNDLKMITETIMEGEDYEFNKDVFEKDKNEQISIMHDEAGLLIEPVGEAKKGHSNACEYAKDWIEKGMTESQKQAVGLN
jgi:hypothetical protein